MRKSELADRLAAPGTDRHRRLMRMTKRELEHKVQLKENFRHKQTVDTGTVCRFDRQSDFYEGEYRVVGFDEVTGVYTAEHLPPSDELVTRVMEDAESGALWVPRGRDRWEEAEREIAYRHERAATTFQVRFVSAEAFAAHF